jgi:2-amino-4-hydroxy-6-hydroxymethyldihydropteridine diphosphokinase
MDHRIYLGLGTNLGDRLANLQTAAESLPPDIYDIKFSLIYESLPWGYTDQPLFLNQVIVGWTRLSPMDVLAYIKQIEQKMGRQMTFQYGPRLIDIDILAYDDLILTAPELTIPHPQMTRRSFVLVPLVDLAPDWRHPVLKQSAQQLLNQLTCDDIKIYDSYPRIATDENEK